jgi:hypothetical protein
MSSDSTSRSTQDDLQFDRAVHTDAPNGPSAGGLTCSICGAALRTQYFHVGEQATCATCKEAVERANQSAVTASRRPGVFARSFGLGLAAAIAGAILYYAVIAITGWEIGLVAIVIGFMVGWAVRRGSATGGRRYQWLAVVLTYFAVGLAYTPLAFKSFAEGNAGNAAVADSSSSTEASPATDPASADSTASAAAEGVPSDGPSVPVALGMTFLFIFALPVMYVVGSMPSGLLSALIILFGMQQAWKMTASGVVPITGPYKVGVNPASSVT